MSTGNPLPHPHRSSLHSVRPAALGLIAGVLWFGAERAFALRHLLPPFLDVLLPTLIAPMVLGAATVAVDNLVRSRRRRDPLRAREWLTGAVSAVAWWVLPFFLFGLVGLPLITWIGTAIGFPIQRFTDLFWDGAPLAGLYIGQAIAGGAYVSGWTILGVAVVRAWLGKEPWKKRTIVTGAAVGALLGLAYGGVLAALWIHDPNTWLMSPLR